MIPYTPIVKYFDVCGINETDFVNVKIRRGRKISVELTGLD